jgi:type 1 fimbriae regulatory protein FimB/type 1 fimbriae regulatory protein FimE
MRKVGSTPTKKTGPRSRSAAAAPTIVKRKVPVRRANSAYRNREYLSEKEVGKVIAAASAQGRHGVRDSALILVAYRHGLRVSELVSLRWDQIDLAQGLVHVARLKNGLPSVHPLRGAELRALRRLQRQEASAAYVFISERKAPLTPDAVRKIVARAGREAGIEFPIHPHMLRHATGYKLANDGHDTRAIQQYLGHRNIQHTTRYTDLAPTRFKDFWKD